MKKILLVAVLLCAGCDNPAQAPSTKIKTSGLSSYQISVTPIDLDGHKYFIINLDGHGDGGLCAVHSIECPKCKPSAKPEKE